MPSAVGQAHSAVFCVSFHCGRLPGDSGDALLPDRRLGAPPPHRRLSRPDRQLVACGAAAFIFMLSFRHAATPAVTASRAERVASKRSACRRRRNLFRAVRRSFGTSRNAIGFSTFAPASNSALPIRCRLYCFGDAGIGHRIVSGGRISMQFIGSFLGLIRSFRALTTAAAASTTACPFAVWS